MKKLLIIVLACTIVSCTSLSREFGKEIEFELNLVSGEAIDYTDYRIEVGGCHITTPLWPICNNRPLIKVIPDENGIHKFNVPIYAYYFIRVYRYGCELQQWAADSSLKELKQKKYNLVLTVNKNNCG